MAGARRGLRSRRGWSRRSAARTPSFPEIDSGAARADEGFWVAVLPFRYSGPNADLTALAEGLTEDVVTGLSRFSYLRVIARGSPSLRYTDKARDLRIVGKELGARYVMEGYLRQAGAKLRLAVQLADAATGAHLWAENYERAFSPDAVFELQDDLVSRIVATVGDPHGILPHTMSEIAPEPGVPGSSARTRLFYAASDSVTAAPPRSMLRCATRWRRRFGTRPAWPTRGPCCPSSSRTNTPTSSTLGRILLGRALDAARRAAALAPSSAVAYDALAWALFFRKDVAAFRAAAEQAIAVNPLSSPTLAGLGTLMAYSGEWEKGCALVERAVQLNPRHPGWYRFALFANAYRQRDYRGAVDIALKLNLPDFFGTHEVLAAAYGQLGERDQAAKALKELLRLRPDYPEKGRERLEKWLTPRISSITGWTGSARRGWKSVTRPETLPRLGQRSRERSVPTGASGSRCCPSSTAAPTPRSRPSPKG